MQERKIFVGARLRAFALVTFVATGFAASYGFTSLKNAAERDITSAVLRHGFNVAHTSRMDMPACTTCHGEMGEGNRALKAPRIAGLPARYIEKQLHDFARDPLKVGVTLDPIARDYSKTPRSQIDLTVYTPGVRRNDAMNSIAATMSTDDIHAVANYYSTLPYNVIALPSDPETLERGEDLALRGKPEYGIPACISCHGPEGRGSGEHFPPLVGQSPEYIIEQINHWQTGVRDNDPMALMRNVAEQLTDGDKINVAAYFANLSVSSQLPVK